MPEAGPAPGRPTSRKPSQVRYRPAALTASWPVRIVIGLNAGRGCAAVRGRGMWAGGTGEDGDGAAATGRTAIRRTVPHGQHSSGCGHWSSRAQDEQRTVTQTSFQLRWPTRTAGASRSSGGVVGMPHGQG